MATSPREPTTNIEQWEIPQSPVRDDSAIAPTEDLDRQPDGAPHMMIGWTALAAVFGAMAVAFMVLTGITAALVAAIVLIVIGIPVLVSRLSKQGERDRDRLHPSR